MAKVKGHSLVAKALKNEGVEHLFWLLGGPMVGVSDDCHALGMKMLDVRHEQAAAFMAHAYSRVTGKPGVCFAGSGPGTVNMATGAVTALLDACPTVILGGSATLSGREKEVFEEVNQLEMFRPITKWATQVADPARIPDIIGMAFRTAATGWPGPVYVDLPGDVLNVMQVEEESVYFPRSLAPEQRVAGDPKLVGEAMDLLERAERPIVLYGSGVLWSKAGDALRELVEAAGVPFFATPQARGCVPDDHPLSFLYARNYGFKEADLLLVIGTRTNYIISHLQPPRFSAAAKVVMVNIDPRELGHNRSADVGVLGDARTVLGQMTAEARRRKWKDNRYASWLDALKKEDAEGKAAQDAIVSEHKLPMHPLQLCHELRESMPRDAILVVDGNEILSFGRQSIPSFFPGHRLNSGVSGCMGVGLPFAVAAKFARPDKPVFCLHGDGSFGMNGWEFDTLVRHNLPVVVVISNNQGWSSRVRARKPGDEHGRVLLPTRYDLLARDFGGHGEYCEKPEEIKPALQRSVASGKPAIVNVMTDPFIRVKTQVFTPYRDV